MRESREEQRDLMRISATHLHALLHMKWVIEQLKAMEHLPLTLRGREVLQESLERAEALLTPEVMQILSSEATPAGKRQDTHESIRTL
jgi:hypothetical protein